VNHIAKLLKRTTVHFKDPLILGARILFQRSKEVLSDTLCVDAQIQGWTSLNANHNFPTHTNDKQRTNPQTLDGNP
jgi:hypothetical protein